MPTPYHRKKQPEVVRRQLLDIATSLLVEEGVKGLTLDAVAKRSSVSKGVLHHFPNRQALLIGLFDDLNDRFFTELEAHIAADKEPHGRVYRAFLRTISQSQPEDDGYLALLLLRDPTVHARWDEVDDKLMTMMAPEHDAFPELHVVRFAASGIWLTDFLGNPEKNAAFRDDVFERLLSMTYPPK